MTELQPRNVRLVTPAVPAVRRQGMTVVSAPYSQRWKLVAHIGQEKRAGRIASTGREWIADGRVHFEIEKLADPPSRTPWYLAAGATGMTAVISLAVLVYHARYVLMFISAVVAVLLLANRVAHSGGCVGIHCTGCRG